MRSRGYYLVKENTRKRISENMFVVDFETAIQFKGIY